MDYIAHLQMSFVQQAEHATTTATRTVPELVAQAIQEIGPSIMDGAISSFLGIVMLAFSKSESYRMFFEMVSLLIALALFNGLLFLPVLLVLFYRVQTFYHKHVYNEQQRQKETASTAETTDEKI